MAAAPTARAGHRERLIDAMAAAVEERGYRDTSIADVVRIARTSRRSFYEHFKDRDACFLALFDSTTEAMMRGIAGAVRACAPLEQQVNTAIGSYLDAFASRPQLFRSFSWELPALGRAGADRQHAVVERFASLLIEFVESARREHAEVGGRPLSRDAARVIVGGLRELTASAFEERRDVRKLRATAVRAVTAILAAAVLEPDERVTEAAGR